MRPLLEVQDLAFRYGSKPVLDQCTFSLAPGERLVIIGSSGSGKSTLLRLILRILEPDKGSIRFEERELADLGAEELDEARRKIGMVYQSAALISSLTVHDNLALPLEEVTDKAPAEIDDIVAKKLSLVGMRDVQEKLPSELSGGMRKRVSFARALVLEPRLMMFDEPASGLDPVNSSLIDDLIVSISENENTGCIVVTHNMASAFRIATDVAMIHEGRIVESGPPDRFRRSDNPIVRQFVSGDPHGPLTEKGPA